MGGGLTTEDYLLRIFCTMNLFASKLYESINSIKIKEVCHHKWQNLDYLTTEFCLGV